MIEWLVRLYTDPTAERLLVAFILGAIVGAERQWRKDVGGLRVSVLVSLGAAAFVDLMTIFGPQGMPQGIGYIVSGIGFLGAGLIIKEGANVRGLNTAATVWCTAAMGATAGASEYTAAALMCLFVTGANLIIRPLVRMLNRQAQPPSLEPAVFTLHAEASGADASGLRGAVSRLVAASGLSLQGLATRTTETGHSQLTAELTAQDGRPDAVQALVEAMTAEVPLTAVRWQAGGMSGGRNAL